MNPSQAIPSALLVASLCLLGAESRAQPDGTSPQESEPRGEVRELFLANCASCHGALGDGNGTAQLDRRARSFQDGGFSYGNTEEALLRTITHGIPGTPMPAFGGAFPVETLRALARHVLSLGPEVREVTSEEARLDVGNRPRVIRGMLPPIHDGAVAHTRGILIGTTSGLTFEYRADDVRLLGVRQGGFVQRTDWTGRGGTPLKPLGQVVHLMAEGLPEATFAFETRALLARLRGTWATATGAGLDYTLESGDGFRELEVSESVAGIVCSVGSGFRREFELHPSGIVAIDGRGGRPGSLILHAAWIGESEPLLEFAGRPGTNRRWSVFRRPLGPIECIGVRAQPPGALLRFDHGRAELAVEVNPTIRLDVLTILVEEWSEATHLGLLELQ